MAEVLKHPFLTIENEVDEEILDEICLEQFSKTNNLN